MRLSPVQILRYHAVVDSYKLSVQEASKKYGFCRTKIYELRKRWKQEGMTGLLPRSSAPKRPFKKVTPRMEALIVYFKKTLPGWGTTRIKNLLESFRICLSEPTIRNVWKKHGFISKSRKTRESFSENIKGGRKNVYWQVDLLVSKLEDGTRFSVLVAVDAFSRYITCLKAMKVATVENVITTLERAFMKEGKPLVIVTDNGTQFCARQDGQVHAFDKFLATSGTCHLRIPRGRPQKNGIVERTVQNVKNEALRPFKDQLLASVQQRLFRWRNWYNFHRRHLGIANERPAELFQPYHHRYGRQFLRDVLTDNFVVSAR